MTGRASRHVEAVVQLAGPVALVVAAGLLSTTVSPLADNDFFMLPSMAEAVE